MTVNALFADLQVLLGDARNPSGLRGGCEFLSQKREASKIRERFGRAKQTVAEFESKLEVWRNRHELLAQVRSGLEGLAETNPAAAVRLEALINETQVPDAELADGWSVQLVKIDPSEQPHLKCHFDEVSRLHGILRVSTLLGLALANAIREEEPTQIDWIASKPNQQAAQGSAKSARPQVWELVEQLANACGWDPQVKEASLVVHVNGRYLRPTNAPRVGAVTVTKTMAPAVLREEADMIADLIRESLYLVHFETCAFFRPNVGTAPMPDLFQIVLPPPSRTPTAGYSDCLKVELAQCSSRVAPPNSVKIALAHFAVPVAYLNQNSFRLDEALYADIERDVRAAIVAAAAEGCQAVIFPEYSLPVRLCDELLQFSTDNNVIVIGGLEGEWLNNKLRDRVVVAIPNEHRLHFQSKQFPSQEEPVIDSFYRDEKLHLFAGSPIGDFAVVVCSDFMQLTTLQAWRSDGPLPDIVFVIARNIYPDLYKSFAQADAFRLYACIAISNVLDRDGVATNDGSLVATPIRNEQISQGQPVQVRGKFLSCIDVHTIPLSAVGSRGRGKPDSGYFAVPRSAQRA